MNSRTSQRKFNPEKPFLQTVLDHDARTWPDIQILPDKIRDCYFLSSIKIKEGNVI